MNSLSERIADRLRDKICRVCIYETAGGGCGLRKDLHCPILTRVDRLIQVVRQVDDSRIDPYVDRLREVVCSECRQQDKNGHCVMRENADCALDDYFPLIVDIIEGELARQPSGA